MQISPESSTFFFSKNPETPHTIQNFPDNSETFQTIQKLSGQSGNVPDNPKTFQTILRLSI